MRMREEHAEGDTVGESRVPPVTAPTPLLDRLAPLPPPAPAKRGATLVRGVAIGLCTLAFSLVLSHPGVIGL